MIFIYFLPFYLCLYISPLKASLPKTQDIMIIVEGYNIQTDSRRLLRLMPGTTNLFALDSVSSTLKSFDYAINDYIGSPNNDDGLQLPYKGIDYFFFPNMTGIILGSDDGVSLSLYMMDIKEKTFTSANISLGYTIDKNVKLVPFYPLRDASLKNDAYFLTYYDNVIEIYTKNLVKIKEIKNFTENFISICPFSERNTIVSVSNGGNLILWTFHASFDSNNTEIFAYFKYSENINESEYVFIERIQESDDLFITLVNNTNILRIWSIDQMKNTMNLISNINGTGVKSINSSLILIYNLNQLNFIDMTNQSNQGQISFSLSIVDISMVSSLNGSPRLMILTADGVLVSVTFDNFTELCCSVNGYLKKNQAKFNRTYMNNYDFWYLYYSYYDPSVFGITSGMLISTISSQNTIYYTDVSPYYFAPSTINVIGSIIRANDIQILLSGYENPCLAINNQSHIYLYTYDAVNNFNLYLSNIFTIPATNTQQAAVYRMNTPNAGDIQGYLIISTSTGWLYLYDITGSLLASTPIEGEVYKFCERNDFTSVLYFYKKGKYYKLGRKTISQDNNFDIIDSPLLGSFADNNFSDIYACLNNFMLNSNDNSYYFSILNPNTGKAEGIRYDITTGNTTLFPRASTEDFWSPRLTYPGYYYRDISGTYYIDTNNSSLNEKYYFGEQIRTIKFDDTDLASFSKYQLNIATINFGCNFYPTYVMTPGTKLCYETDCSTNFISETVNLVATCLSTNTCPAGTYDVNLISSEADTNSNYYSFDICRSYSFLIENCVMTSLDIDGDIVCVQCLPSYYLLKINSKALYCINPVLNPDKRLILLGTQLTDGTGIN